MMYGNRRRVVLSPAIILAVALVMRFCVGAANVTSPSDVTLDSMHDSSSSMSADMQADGTDSVEERGADSGQHIGQETTSQEPQPKMADTGFALSGKRDIAVSEGVADQDQDMGASPETSGLGKWINIITAVVLISSVLIAYRAYENASRPVIKFVLTKPNGFELNPVLENVSKTDAIGHVVFRFLVKDKGEFTYDEDEGAYCGKWTWNLPAGQGITGTTDIGKTVKRIFGYMRYPPDRHLKLQAVVVYSRWRRHLGWKVYSSPVKVWEMYSDGRWAFVPAHEFPTIPLDVDVSKLRGWPWASRESRGGRFGRCLKQNPTTEAADTMEV